MSKRHVSKCYEKVLDIIRYRNETVSTIEYKIYSICNSIEVVLFKITKINSDSCSIQWNSKYQVKLMCFIIDPPGPTAVGGHYFW